MRKKIEVSVGQIWEDCDKRNKHVRRLKVLEVHAGPFGQAAKQAKVEPYAICVVIGTTRKVTIKLRRLRPGSTGYQLLDMVDIVTELPVCPTPLVIPK